MRVEDIANVIAGQIMTRVTDEGADEDVVPILVPKAINEGMIVREYLGKAVLAKPVDEERYTKEGDVVVKLSTPYDAAYVTEDNVGLIVPSFCAIVRVKQEEKMNAKYLSAFFNTEFIRNQLLSRVVGSLRPMIKITDIRSLELPRLSVDEMNHIGEAYILSGKKRTTLYEMIETERKMMDNIVLMSIKDGMKSE